MTSPLGEETTYSYDAAGRRTSMVSPGATPSVGVPARLTPPPTLTTASTAWSPCHGSKRIHHLHDLRQGGQQDLGDRPNGNTTTYSYDADDDLVTITAPGGAATTNRRLRRQWELTSVTDPMATPPPPPILRRRQPADKTTDALGRSTTYTYDADGNRLTSTDAVGATTTYTYDAVNRLTAISYSDGTPTVTYTYDADGNRTR